MNTKKLIRSNLLRKNREVVNLKEERLLSMNKRAQFEIKLGLLLGSLIAAAYYLLK